jgi:hypothetical protein
MQYTFLLWLLVLVAECRPTFWTDNAALAEQHKAIMDELSVIKDQNTLQKALTLSVLDLLIDFANDDESLAGPTERTKVLHIARSLSRKHRREASMLPSGWNNALAE